jgi:hypothetical protein
MSCDLCGETRGSFVQTLGMWLCLRHLPGMGRRRHGR